MNIFEQVWHIGVIVFLAIFGALARFLNQKDKMSFKISNIVSGCFIAAFAGMLVYFICQIFDLDLNVGYLLAGICGWTGPQILDSISAIVLQKMGIDTKDDDTKK